MRFLFYTALVVVLNCYLADAKPVASVEPRTAVSTLDNPGLTFLTSINATVGRIYDFGAGPHGKREIATISGGSATGPQLNGTVLNLGANWLLGDTKGVLQPDARAAFCTDDGAYVYVQLEGSGPGIKIGSVTYTNVMFETSSDKYWWLNDIIAVSRMSTNAAWVLLDVWYLSDSVVSS